MTTFLSGEGGSELRGPELAGRQGALDQVGVAVPGLRCSGGGNEYRAVVCNYAVSKPPGLGWCICLCCLGVDPAVSA